MRTTLNIDEDLLAAAKAMAAQQGVSIGKIVSELMRKGLTPAREPKLRPGYFPVFDIPEGARPITSETVTRAEEDS